MFWNHRRFAFPFLVDGDLFAGRREAVEARRFLAEVGREFHDAARYLHVGVKVDTPAGVTWRLPRVGSVPVGPRAFAVELLPGQVVDDLRAPAGRVAEVFGAPGVRFEPMPGRWIKVVLLA